MEGLVQGVGLRPFVHALATRLELGGVVRNDTSGVVIEVEGDEEAVGRFLGALERDPPPLAVIERVEMDTIEPVGDRGFRIVGSTRAGTRRTIVPADVATCGECLAELLDPGDRRHRYPFVNCTNCGPRFTIIRRIPYDRAATTMAGFPMCPRCAREYADPGDRRFHAEPTCCPSCGPSVRLLDARGRETSGDPIQTAARLLRERSVMAVKGLGGFHLAVLGSDEEAVALLRAHKHREEKPFALMVPDVQWARRLCEIDRAEQAMLTGPQRPIVLLRRRSEAPVAPSVAPGNRFLGLMLPYTPLHHLLLQEVGAPIVLTSGNVADEPIAFLDEDALDRLGPLADHHLLHDRPIHVRTDDSVARSFRGAQMVLRRSRGYVPQPVSLPWPFPRHVLAVGAELKNAFCLAKGRHAFVSHHIGDLENFATFRSFTEGIDHFRRLFDIHPAVVAHDLHPEYLSTKHAHALEGVELVGVQHHHAHVASCLADNGIEGLVIGVAFDGLGFGEDGSIWGGEILVADLTTYERVAHLEPVPMPGGVAAIREPWRMAAAYLAAAFGAAVPEDLEVARRNHDRWDDVLRVAAAGVNSPPTSSAGRLFDAVSAILGARDRIAYEGQAAIELEQLADPTEDVAYSATVEGEPLRISGVELIRGVVGDLRRGVAASTVAGRFHNGLAAAIVGACRAVRRRTGLSTTALSGGVFQNVLLLDRVVAGLEGYGFRVLVHSRVPPNDGGISLGQAAVAGAVDRTRREGP
jgi:hydrogenase maturation protein HypF